MSFTFDDFTVSLFFLLLDVTGVGVVDTVFESIPRVGVLQRVITI